MCMTIVGQILFGVTTAIVLVLTFTAIFTPAWKTHWDGTKTGIVTGCYVKKEFAERNLTAEAEICKEWFAKQPRYEKAMLGMFGVSLLLQITSAVWLAISFCTCCCKKHFIKALPGIVFLYTVLMVAALAIFHAKFKQDSRDSVETVHDITNGKVQGMDALLSLSTMQAYSVGYSFGVACLSCFFGVVALIVALILSCVKTVV